MQSVYKKWCNEDPLTPAGIRNTLKDGTLVVAHDIKKANKIIGCISLVPEMAPRQHYEFRHHDKEWKSIGMEITDVGLAPEYRGNGVVKGMVQYLIWTAYDKMKNEWPKRTVFSEALYPWACNVLDSLGLPIGGESPMQPKEMKYFERTGTLMRHVQIIPSDGLVNGSPLTDHVVYRASLA